MALHLKIYREGQYVAACRNYEEASAIAALAEGIEVRLGHAVADRIWTEGADGQYASESLDYAIGRMRERVPIIVRERLRHKVGGRRRKALF